MGSASVTAWHMWVSLAVALPMFVRALDPLDAEPPPVETPPRETNKESGDIVALRLFSPVRSTTQEAIKAEVIAAEAALEMRAEVDGLPVVYDSPAVSISLRKVSPDALMQNGAEVEASDGASVKIPADPRIKGRHGGPVTVTVTSYHAGDAVKEMPKVKYGAQRQMRAEPDLTTAEQNSSLEEQVNSSNQTHNGTKNDRVDFFMTKTSVSWRGTVDVKMPGLSAQVPAHDRPWTPYGESVLYPEEKAGVREELERLAALQDNDERLRGCRKLARQWHPDNHPPEDREKATEIFEYMQELRLALGLSVRGRGEDSQSQ